jgi:type IV pilus assembly protein PilQ
VDNLVTQVPFLGDIPFIGNFFKYRSTTEQRRELLVFISPQIVAK